MGFVSGDPHSYERLAQLKQEAVARRIARAQAIGAVDAQWAHTWLIVRLRAAAGSFALAAGRACHGNLRRARRAAPLARG